MSSSKVDGHCKVVHSISVSIPQNIADRNVKSNQHTFPKIYVFNLYWLKNCPCRFTTNVAIHWK